MKIDIDTKFVTLIGTPLGQSFAARMQNAGYQQAGMNLCYFYTQADDQHLKEIIDGIRYMPSFIGAAVTRPNKIAVLPYLDGADPLCQKMGSCNTVVKDPNGRLIGYNTDGIGFVTSLVQDGEIDPQGKTFFCVGAGGAGRSICAALANAGATKVYVTDLYQTSAQSLAADINSNFAPVAQAVPFGDFTLARTSDCLLNATGIGMGKTRGTSPVPTDVIQPHHFCFDACYNPRKTQFLLDAESKGCTILDGLGMSLHQGAEQIRLWTGETPPVDALRAELEAICAELTQAGDAR